MTLYVGVRQVLAGALPSGALVAAMMLVWRVLGIARSAFVVFNQIESLGGSLRQLQRFMALPQETKPVAFTVPQRLPEGDLQFRDISFRYGPEGYPALYGVSFAAPAGKLTVLTGHQGAGKTTIIKLALALYRPQAGRVMIGPFNIQQSDVTVLRQAIAYAGELPMTLGGSIADFIRASSSLGDKGLAELAERLGLVEALGEAGLSLDSRFDAIEEDRRPDIERLSAIARACARSATMYLFDEQRFRLSGRYMERFAAALRRLAGRNAVVLAVSNERIMLDAADRVVRLDGGRLAGTENRKTS